MSKPVTLLAQSGLFAGALFSAALMMSASTGTAFAQGTSYYSAELASPIEKTTKIDRGIVWSCEGNSCAGTKATSRADNVCKRLARKMGPVTSFSAKGEAFDEAALAACNAA